MIVLGSTQSIEFLVEDVGERYLIRRRRGGGGLVLLRPGDLWIDWWIPTSDQWHRNSVGDSARLAGEWWTSVLNEIGTPWEVHRGPSNHPPTWRKACFATLGEGEVHREGRKLVGVTQWRVREGTLLSTAALAIDSTALLDEMTAAPPGLGEALRHESLESSGWLERAAELADRVVRAPQSRPSR
jgi:lipoate-protein ligase A